MFLYLKHKYAKIKKIILYKINKKNIKRKKKENMQHTPKKKTKKKNINFYIPVKK